MTASASNSIDWITVEGFRSIAQVTQLPLNSVNILIGANGSGKSNLISVFALLRALRLKRLDEYVKRSGGADRNLHYGSKVTREVFIEIAFDGRGRTHDGREWTHKVHIASTDADELFLRSEAISGLAAEKVLDELDREDGVRKDFVEMVQESLDRWRVYHFHDTGRGAALMRTAQLDDNRLLREDGGNLAAFLYHLKHKDRTSYNRIRKTFQLVAPFFEDFVLEPRALDEQTIRLEWRHRRSDAHFDVSVLSDGSLRFLALATLLLQPVKLLPSVLLLDEPELGLHPYAVTVLCSLVRSVASETQVILATQSPFLVDHFEPEDVIVANRVEGRSEFGRLSAEELGDWLEEYSLGDLWLKNELGGRPAFEDTLGNGDT